MVAALLDLDASRRIRAARIAISAASEKARRLRALEQRLVGTSADDAEALQARDEDLAGLSPIDDVRATADYRRDAARKLVARALAQAAGRADAELQAAKLTLSIDGVAREIASAPSTRLTNVLRETNSD